MLLASPHGCFPLELLVGLSSYLLVYCQSCPRICIVRNNQVTSRQRLKLVAELLATGSLDRLMGQFLEKLTSCSYLARRWVWNQFAT